jgi:hypothetical protein
MFLYIIQKSVLNCIKQLNTLFRPGKFASQRNNSKVAFFYKKLIN